MNWSFVFPAQHEDPEGGSVVQQLTIRKIDLENELEKIRNAETGKFAGKNNATRTTFVSGFSGR